MNSAVSSSVTCREGLGGASVESPVSSVSSGFSDGSVSSPGAAESVASPFGSSLSTDLGSHFPASSSLSSIFLAFLFSARQQHFSTKSSPLLIPLPMPLPLPVVLVVVLSLSLNDVVSGYRAV